MSRRKLKEECRSLSKDFRRVAKMLDDVNVTVNAMRGVSEVATVLSQVAAIGKEVASELDSGATARSFLDDLSKVCSDVGTGSSVASDVVEVLGKVMTDTEMAHMETKWEAFKDYYGLFIEEALEAPTLTETVCQAVGGVLSILNKMCNYSEVNALDISRALKGRRSRDWASRGMVELPTVQVDGRAVALTFARLIEDSFATGEKTKSPGGQQLRHLADRLDDLYMTL